MNATRIRKIALWHRYGPGGHVECGGHAMPGVVDRLAETCDVHYFGTRSRKPAPPSLQAKAALHYLPFRFNRSSTRDKFLKTALWYLALPCMALRCRWMGVDAVFMDETLPLSALIVRTFYGQKVAMTVADFFMTIYFRRLRWLRPLCRMVEALDLAAWRRLPLIFTHVRHARSYLAERGVPADRIHPVYNPCDRRTYFPRDRVEARRRFGIPADALVLVHHGILHPNKGNDRIIRAVADLRRRVPNLLYLLVGSGPERERLVALAGSLGVPDGVLFTGWLPAEEDVNWALNAADIGLVMRIGQFSDSFHITDTLVHEMACRLPILAARLAGIEEVIRDGENGFLFDPDDLEEFKAKLLALAADPALRERLGRAALEVCAREFDLDRAADQMAGPLLRLVAAD